jgi:hypothetical protein
MAKKKKPVKHDDVETVLETVKVEEVLTSEDDQDIPEVQPAYGSPDWSDYVMRQFKDEELTPEGSPSCDGCRRVVEKLLGSILSALPVDNVPPTNDNRATATVIFEVEIRINNPTHPSHGDVIRRGDIADVNKFNTGDPYHKHASASAATMAEGRVYRKLLGIRGLVAEEKTKPTEEFDEVWIEEEPIEEGQIQVIDLMCKRCDLDVLEFINCGRNKYALINVVPKSAAINMISLLNRVQQDPSERPNGISEYKEDWRNN